MSSESSSEGSRPIARKPIFILTLTVLIMAGLVVTKSVPLGDILFVVFATVHWYAMSKVAFPPPAEKPAFGSWRFPGGKYFAHYMLGSAVLSLLLPLVQILFCFLSNDEMTVRESAPHLFLLSAQVLTEVLTARTASISMPVKAMIPVMYNARRLLTLHTWAAGVFSRDLRSSLSFASTAWHVFWRSVVVGNVLFWHYNLWAFLIPVYVPWSLGKYYTAMNTKVE